MTWKRCLAGKALGALWALWVPIAGFAQQGPVNPIPAQPSSSAVRVIGARSIRPFSPPAAQRAGTLLPNAPAYGGGGSPWLDVKTFGARGDGATDDTTAIDNALAAAAGAGGGVVYFPAGTYKFGRLDFPYTGRKGGWVTLLVNGVLAPTATITITTGKYAIVGMGAASADPAFTLEPGAAILPGALNPVIKVTNGPALIRNLYINDCAGDGILYQTGQSNNAGLTLDNVAIQQASNAPNTTAPLHVIDSILLRSYRSAFVAAQTTSPRPPAVWFQGSANQVIDHFMRDTTLDFGGIKISSTANVPMLNFVFDGVLTENVNAPIFTLDARNSPVADITIEHLWPADGQDGVAEPCLGAPCPIIYALSSPGTNVAHVHLLDIIGVSSIGGLIANRGPSPIQGLDVMGTNTSNFPMGQANFNIWLNPSNAVFAPPSGTIFASPLAVGLQTVTFTSTPRFDASAGNAFQITLKGNVSGSTFANAFAGQVLYFRICQDVTGGRSFVWPSQVRGGMTVGRTPNTCSTQMFLYDGTSAYALGPGAKDL